MPSVGYIIITITVTRHIITSNFSNRFYNVLSTLKNSCRRISRYSRKNLEINRSFISCWSLFYALFTLHFVWTTNGIKIRWNESFDMNFLLWQTSFELALDYRRQATVINATECRFLNFIALFVDLFLFYIILIK